MESDLAALLKSLDSDQRRRGRQFEELCRWYLLNYRVYQIAQVWLWNDWPGRWGEDAGIDLVAETRDGHLWAIQAKAYNPDYSIKKADIDSFLSESARSEFSYRLLIATTDKVARLAERTMRAQEKPVGQVLLHDLERMEVCWPSTIADLRPEPPKRKSPRLHQQEAINAVLKGFAEADRGQLIMACGTGKTLASLWIREAMEAERTLVLVPSLSLLKQTIGEWLLNSTQEFEFLPVCSDDTVRDQDQMVSSVAELGLPATGESDEVAAFLDRPGSRVVFATYHSSPVVASAMAKNDRFFDLTIADEAHRCAGPVSSGFATILDKDQIRATKRLFMTATPRYFTGRIKKAGIEADFEIASMDDDARFGSVFHRLTFSEAIDRDLLSDYQVLVIGVDDDTYREYAEKGRFVTRDGTEVTDARSLASQIGLARAMRRYNLRRTITFHGRVKAAKNFADSLPDVIAWMPAEERPHGAVWADHVSGAMNSSQREIRLRRLRNLDGDEHGVLANARCLGEGVDAPTLDAVAFIDPKRSEVDIAQAVGRAIRKAENKLVGTVVIPVFVGSDADAGTALEASAFKPVWDVIRALRDHDEELAEALDELRRALGRRYAPRVRVPTKIVIELPARIGDDFIRAFETVLVEQTTLSWEFRYGLLEDFVEREGHARVPRFHVENGYKLGTWIHSQRQVYGRDRLDSERIRRLEALPRWTWDPLEAAWEEAFGRLQRFVERAGDARVPQSQVEDGFNLGTWVSSQRSRRDKLDTERVRRLEALPRWTWNVDAAAWEEGFAHVQRFVEREENARVPRSQIENGFKLGVWVHAQRRSYEKDKLDADQIRRLEALPGWEWNVFEAAWEEAFAHLERFVEREGSARVQTHYAENGFKLGMWCSTQRRDRKDLPIERIRRLEALPDWEWDRFAGKWEEAFAHLERFVEREGNARVPQSHVENGFKLGAWSNRQRQLYRKEKLNAGRVRRLEALPGWKWRAR